MSTDAPPPPPPTPPSGPPGSPPPPPALPSSAATPPASVPPKSPQQSPQQSPQPSSPGSGSDAGSPPRRRWALIGCLAVAVVGVLGLIVAGSAAWFFVNRARSAAEGALADLREELDEPAADRLDELVARAGLVGVAESLPDESFVELPQAVARHLVPLASPLIVVDAGGAIRVSDGEAESVLVEGPEDVVAFAASVLAFEPDSIFVVKADRDLPWGQVDQVLDAVAQMKGRGAILLAESSPEAPADESFPALPGGLFLLRSSNSGWSWPEPVAAWFRQPPAPVEPPARPSPTASTASTPRRPPPRAIPIPEEPEVEEPPEPADSEVAEAPRANEAVDEPYLVQGDITKPVPIDAPPPSYTEVARRARIQGIVILQLVIEKDGTVRSAQVLKGLPMGLSEAAVEAVRGWRFQPATLNGEPLVVSWNLTVRFEL